MNKRARTGTVLICPLLLVFLLGIFVQIGTGQTSISVSGIISSNTTWTKEGSPYNLEGPTRIAKGVTLTIESGVTVNFNGYNLEVEGTLAARGSRIDPIDLSYGSGSSSGIIFSQSSTAWNEQTGSGCILENVVMRAITLSISGSPKIFNNSIGGAQAIPNTIQIDAGSAIIANNEIRGGFESSNTILITGGSPVISNNKITGYVDNGLAGLYMDTSHMVRFGASVPIVISGGNVYLSDNDISGGSHGISVDAAKVVIERNLFGLFAFGAIGIGASATVLIQNNTFTADSGGISGVNPSTTINYNNIENTYGYDIQVSQNGVINAINNWWGTTSESEISNKIQGGTVNFVPFLAAPNPQALPNSLASPLVLPTPPKPTRTTVSIPQAMIAKQAYVTISGTIVDEDGVPLASTPVVLTIVTSSGDSTKIGPILTDASGIYSTDWMPQFEGAYTVTATFEGTQSYSSSNAVISFTVGPATPDSTSSSDSSSSSIPEQSNLQNSNQSVLIGEGNTTLILLIVVAALLSIIGILLVNKRRQPHPTQNQVLDKTPKAALKH
jgi:hypothetical protein